MSLTPGALFTMALLLAEQYVIDPSRVFDGESLHSGWRVVVRDERIEAAGPRDAVATPPGAEVLELEGTTVLPGLIEAHSHVLLHAYDEASWNDQVSSLYTSTYLVVFEDANYEGDYAVLAPGFHDLASLSYYGIDNDTLSSFYAVA